MKQHSMADHSPVGVSKPAGFFLWAAFWFYIGLWLSTGSEALAQSRIDRTTDSTYVKTFPEKLTGRLYLSQKYTSFTLATPSKPVSSLRFRPNASLDLGVGATFKALTVNLSYGLAFLNKNNGKGKTRDVDIQTHIYMRKWVLDGFGQFYKGYFLAPRGTATSSQDLYYQRPDLGVYMVGASVRRVFNFRRFSFRAALVQNEWQKKSAGSWLVGVQFYYGIIRGDSALVPGLLQTSFSEEDVRRMRFLKFGPGAGYAYTYVYREHFFATASLTANLNATFSKESFENGKLTYGNMRPDLLFRVVAGYNSDLWGVTLGWINGSVSVMTPIYKYTVYTGNYRLTVARRFKPHPRLRKIIPDAIKI